jgi:hypothetical protein
MAAMMAARMVARLADPLPVRLVAVLVVLDADLEVVQQAPAVLGDAEQVHPGAVGAAGPGEPRNSHLLGRSAQGGPFPARRRP